MKEKIKETILKTIKNLQEEKSLPFFEIDNFQVDYPENEIYGDYFTNVALLIGKKISKNPLEVANLIKAKIESQNLNIFEKIEVKEPGFINFFLKKEIFIKELKKILKEKQNYQKNKKLKKKKLVIDYSSPNVAKVFGIGHLRSTIIGQAIYNLYKFLGWDCVGINHLGDWGTQFGNLIFALKKWGNKKENYTIEDLEKLYIRFHQESQKNEKLIEEGRNWFKKLESGDKEALKIWKKILKISLKEFNSIYKLLNVKIDCQIGESFYKDKVKEVLRELQKTQFLLESQGALIFQYPENELPPAMILKSDGTTTYFLRDLAAIKYRLEKRKPDLIVYEVGSDQILHFKQLFKAVKLLNWDQKICKKEVHFYHLFHGLYITKEGKLSTRKGRTFHLIDILEEAIERAEKILEKSEVKKNLSKKEKEKIAKIVGIGAIKYNDLKQHPSKEILFDWEKILNLKGDSGPYLQYTYVRCRGVLRKGKKIQEKKIKNLLSSLAFGIHNLTKEENNILKEIYKFPEIIQEAAEKFSPNLICNYIFNLAQKYNYFYDTQPILKAQKEELKIFRLALTIAIAQVLKTSLNLLGISVPEKM